MFFRSTFYLLQGGYVLVVVCSFVCLQLCARTSKRISMKFSGMVGNGPMNKWLNLVAIRITIWIEDCFPDSSLLGDTESGYNNNNNDRFTALCPGLSGWAGTRRNTHPPTILIIMQSYQLLPSTAIHSVLPVQIACLAIFLYKQLSKKIPLHSD